MVFIELPGLASYQALFPAVPRNHLVLQLMSRVLLRYPQFTLRNLVLKIVKQVAQFRQVQRDRGHF